MKAGSMHGLPDACGRALGNDHRGDLRLDLRGGLLAGERDFGHRIFFDVLGLVLRLPDDILGLSTGFGDDLRCLVLSLGDQTVGFGASFLQPLVVELLESTVEVCFP